MENVPTGRWLLEIATAEGEVHSMARMALVSDAERASTVSVRTHEPCNPRKLKKPYEPASHQRNARSPADTDATCSPDGENASAETGSVQKRHPH